eukprot:51709_1
MQSMWMWCWSLEMGFICLQSIGITSNHYQFHFHCLSGLNEIQQAIFCSNVFFVFLALCQKKLNEAMIFIFFIYALISPLKCAGIIFDGNCSSLSASMPFALRGMAVGSFNNSIFVIGGEYDVYQGRSRRLIEYHTTENHFTEYGSNYLNQYVFGTGAFYTQKQNRVYMISINGQRLSMMDLATPAKLLETNWNDVTIPHAVGEHGCLASNDEYMFIVGGFISFSLNHLQILSLSTWQWLSNPPSLNLARRGISCPIHEPSGFMYAIGGYSYQLEASFEKISIENILSKDWTTASNSLIHGADSQKSIVYHDYILVIGGWRAFNPHLANYQFQIIDTKTDTISLSDSLILNASGGALGVIMVENTIYRFGGMLGSLSSTDHSESCKLFSPSKTPTQPPTGLDCNWQCYLDNYVDLRDAFGSDLNRAQNHYITLGYSENRNCKCIPTEPPTDQPTHDPSKYPSNVPSTAPTRRPSVPPSEAPTSHPSQSPTSNPTDVPTIKPSISHPTSSPPTVSPTHVYPTLIISPTERTTKVTQYRTVITTETQDDSNLLGKVTIWSWMLWVLVSLSLMILIAIIALVCWWCKDSKRANADVVKIEINGGKKQQNTHVLSAVKSVMNTQKEPKQHIVRKVSLSNGINEAQSTGRKGVVNTKIVHGDENDVDYIEGTNDDEDILLGITVGGNDAEDVETDEDVLHAVNQTRL